MQCGTSISKNPYCYVFENVSPTMPGYRNCQHLSRPEFGLHDWYWHNCLIESIDEANQYEEKTQQLI